MVDRHTSRAAPPGPTLADFVTDTWAPKARRRLAPKTWERDAVIYRKHIRPRLGDHPIASLDVEDLVVWQDGLEANGVGAPTIAKAIGILSSIFREAARRPRSTGVEDNPVALLEKPKARRRRQPRVWGPVVVERVRWELLAGSRRAGRNRELAAHRDALLVALMEMTGCRPGEALALRWMDVGRRLAIARRLSGVEIIASSGDRADDFLFRARTSRHWVETNWRNYRSRHFKPALRRVEAGWEAWRAALADPDATPGPRHPGSRRDLL